MRKIVNSTFVSLDGVIENMEAWHFDYVDQDTHRITLEQLRAAEILLMGRRTYESYAAVWPDRTGEYPDGINAMRKYVASTTLEKAEWTNTTVISSGLVDEVRRLRDEGGGDILMHGFGPVARELLAAGLLDELFLWVHPKFAGVGTVDQMLFNPGVDNAFELAAPPQALASGMVNLRYRPKS
jgi:dihydrofolate reductase